MVIVVLEKLLIQILLYLTHHSYSWALADPFTLLENITIICRGNYMGDICNLVLFRLSDITDILFILLE